MRVKTASLLPPARHPHYHPNQRDQQNPKRYLNLKQRYRRPIRRPFRRFIRYRSSRRFGLSHVRRGRWRHRSWCGRRRRTRLRCQGRGMCRSRRRCRRCRWSKRRCRRHRWSRSRGRRCRHSRRGRGRLGRYWRRCSGRRGRRLLARRGGSGDSCPLHRGFRRRAGVRRRHCDSRFLLGLLIGLRHLPDDGFLRRGGSCRRRWSWGRRHLRRCGRSCRRCCRGDRRSCRCRRGHRRRRSRLRRDRSRGLHRGSGRVGLHLGRSRRRRCGRSCRSERRSRGRGLLAVRLSSPIRHVRLHHQTRHVCQDKPNQHHRRCRRRQPNAQHPSESAPHRFRRSRDSERPGRLYLGQLSQRSDRQPERFQLPPALFAPGQVPLHAPTLRVADLTVDVRR